LRRVLSSAAMTVNPQQLSLSTTDPEDWIFSTAVQDPKYTGPCDFMVISSDPEPFSSSSMMMDNSCSGSASTFANQGASRSTTSPAIFNLKSSIFRTNTVLTIQSPGRRCHSRAPLYSMDASPGQLRLIFDILSAEKYATFDYVEFLFVDSLTFLGLARKFVFNALG
jgi:hypothetical protein